MVEVINTYTGYSRTHGRVKSTIGYAYRCAKCGLITLNKEEAKPHLKCKEKEKMKRVIEIRAAEGGEDSKLFVKDLAQAYIKFAQSKG